MDRDGVCRGARLQQRTGPTGKWKSRVGSSRRSVAGPTADCGWRSLAHDAITQAHPLPLSGIDHLGKRIGCMKSTGARPREVTVEAPLTEVLNVDDVHQGGVAQGAQTRA